MVTLFTPNQKKKSKNLNLLLYLYSSLQDNNISQEGDLYIRSVCFSPDGRYLATGAEDKQIRVKNSSLLTT
jgi:WD40 repeat protein